MTTQFIRAYCARDLVQSEVGTPIRFVASTEGVARDGMIIEAAAWRIDNYRQNPVFLWAHDYTRPPIGRTETNVMNGQLITDVTFDQADEFARSIERKYRDNMMNAVSVGWNTLEMKPGTPPRITGAELLDISAVPVPADPQALKERQMRGWLDLQQTLNDVLHERADYPWDQCMKDQMEQYGDEETAKKVCGMIKAKYGHAFEEADAQERDRILAEIEKELDIKRAARPTSDAVWSGVASAMLALYHQHTAIEETDRKALYNLLERAYRKLGKTPPEYRTSRDLIVLCPRDIDGLFLQGEASIMTRIGAVLSARNRDDLSHAIELIQAVIDRAAKEEPQQQGVDPLSTQAREQLLAVRLRQAFKTT